MFYVNLNFLKDVNVTVIILNTFESELERIKLVCECMKYLIKIFPIM